MGQIVSSAAKSKRCNLQSLSQLGTPAAGEYILVSSDNSMNAAGQGNFDCYIEGNGRDAAEDLPLLPTNDDVYDISARHSGATYADLAAALGTNGANVPAGVRRGGMSVKFVQTSDNKYVQYRLMSDTFSTTESDWQGVDDEPTDGSDALVKSGGVKAALNTIDDKIEGSVNYQSEPISMKLVADGGDFSSTNPTIASGSADYTLQDGYSKMVAPAGYNLSAGPTLVGNENLSPHHAMQRYVDCIRAHYKAVNCRAHFEFWAYNSSNTYLGAIVFDSNANTEGDVELLAGKDNTAYIIVGLLGFKGGSIVDSSTDAYVEFNNLRIELIEPIVTEGLIGKVEDLQNATEGLQGDIENIVQLLPTNDIVVGKYDVSGYNSGDTGYDKYIANGGGINTYSGYSILGPISLNKGDVLSSVVNGSGMAFLAKVNQDESMTPIILAPQQNTTQTIEYAAEDNIVVMLSSNRTQFNGYTITRKGEAASKQSVDELSAKVDSMGNTHNIGGDCALLDREILLLTNREYYFDESYSAETSYINTSYLEQKIADVPKGKHFIFMTDSHIDYGHDIGKLQNETPVIKYVRDRLSIRNVIFGGDAIGVQPTKYKAAKVLSNYVNKNFEAFGSGFLFVMGNHDTNPFVPSGGTIEDALISDVEVYKRTTRYMECYGIAKYPNKLIGIINTSNDLIDNSGNAMTQTQKNEFVAWAKHNYYYDDENQKIRYIVLETGDGGNTMREIFGTVGDAGNSLMVIAYFLVGALMNVPEDYDVVIAAHWIVRGGAFWKKVFYKVLALYQNKSSDIVNFVPNTYQHPAVQPIVEKTFDNPSSLSLTVDFTENLGSGRIFCIDGHMHYDRATINEYVSDSDDISDDSFPLSTSESPQSKTYSAASILHITCDRCCAIEQYVNPEISNTYSYPNDISIYPDTGVQRLGTIKEVLFDVVTITNDNRVVLTRFGAEGEQDGSPLVRDYVLPI